MRPLGRVAIRALLVGPAVFPAVALAQDECPVFIEKMRFEEDWTCLRGVESRMGFDRLKAIPVGHDGWLDIGGEIRQRYEITRDPAFGADPDDPDGVWLQRYTIHGDLRLGAHLRLFAQLSSALETGRAGGASPVDENRLAVQNLFADLRVPLARGTLAARFGRQELQFGSGRLIDVREGPNVRRTFDAVRPFVESGDWRVDGILARPIDTDPGIFDDDRSRDEALWGVYAVRRNALMPGAAIDIYYLGHRDEAARFAQGAGEATRHSLGARFSGQSAGWDWNWEGVYQFGSFAGGNLSAWTLASQTGYTFEDAPWRPRIALSANIASGDDDPDDADLGTFDPLFPRGNYFSEAAVLGPRNFWNLHGFVTVNPHDRLSLIADYNLYWRLETGDGVYGPAGNLIRPAGGAERFVAAALSLTASYVPTERLLLTAIFTRVSPRAALREAGLTADIDFFELTAQFRF